MCGIAGRLSSAGAVEEPLIERMCAAIEHRGPDSRGTFVDDGAGLGIQRLRIIDLETGDQPIFNEDESVVVVLNGEIYNYRELRAELEARGHRFSTRTDTEVIVHLYEDHDERCVEHLRGMFAFALWDRRRRRLLIARDRVGKKPLFYADRDGEFWFGSEVKAILEDPEVPRDVDSQAIDAYLRFGYVPDPQSSFHALRKLPPGHLLTWHAGALEVRRYWHLDFSTKDEYSSEREMQERVRSELLDATRLRLRSDVPLGAFLSGGVDSSAVVAAMAQLSSTPVKTFSIGFDVASFDETSYAREVAELFGTEHHEFRVEPEAVSILPKLVWHYGEPFSDQAAIPSLYLAELTRRHVTVALNGDGGDEDFFGYGHHRAALRLDRFPLMPRGLLGAAARLFDRIGPGPRPDDLRSRARRAAHMLAMAPDARYASLLSMFPEYELPSLYTPEFWAELGPNRPALHVIRDPWLASTATNELDRLLEVDVRTLLPGMFLVKADIAAMAHSLEVRSPLLDQRFMEMAARLPANAKYDGHVGKRVFKDALREWIPSRILDRPKMGFGVPISEWLRGPLRDLPADVLLDPAALERGMFRPEAVERIVARHRDGIEDMGRKIWVLLQLELWLRTFVDVRRSDPVAIPV
jgi:asparagine synthase (glutamine-hydrolysing)